MELSHQMLLYIIVERKETMLDALKVIILGIVEGITEWLPVSSTGHLILVGDVLSPNLSHDFMEMFNVVIQLGAIMAVVVLYFHKLNPFSPKKTHKQKLLTWQMWIKVAIACVPAAVVGILLNDWLDSVFYKPLPVSIMLIVYGILFIVVENRNKNRKPEVTKISELDIRMLLWIGAFQMLALIPGTSRSGATIVGALLIGVSREVAAEFTFFLAIPVMFGASLLKLVKFGFAFTGAEFGYLMLGCIVSFGLSIVAIKFLMNYIKKNDFKVFGSLLPLSLSASASLFRYALKPCTNSEASASFSSKKVDSATPSQFSTPAFSMMVAFSQVSPAMMRAVMPISRACLMMMPAVVMDDGMNRTSGSAALAAVRIALKSVSLVL